MQKILQLLVFVLAAQAAAQESDGTDSAPQNHSYLGIQPGSRDTAPGKEKVKSNNNFAYITWIGFQASHPGGRVFIQGSEQLNYHVISNRSDAVVIEIEGAKLHYRNDGRPIDARAFGTAVSFIETAVKPHNVVQVTIKMRKATPYEIRQEGGYIFIDFAQIKAASSAQ